jgi:hypothetical protein
MAHERQNIVAALLFRPDGMIAAGGSLAAFSAISRQESSPAKLSAIWAKSQKQETVAEPLMNPLKHFELEGPVPHPLPIRAGPCLPSAMP